MIGIGPKSLFFGSFWEVFFEDISMFLVFSESDIQYSWQGEISVCKVLVPIKIVPVKKDYFLQPSSNCIYISNWIGSSVVPVFAENNLVNNLNLIQST